MTFTASNGVELDDYGNWDGGGPAELVERHKARMEFYQHLRDEELGRWRWPSNLDYVVYPQHDGSVLVTFERIGESSILYRRDDPVHDMEGEAARAYFTAHPVRKPWHDAKPGEVWALTIDHAGVRAEYDGAVACYLDERGDFVATQGLMRIDQRDAQITGARRIWPEAS